MPLPRPATLQKIQTHNDANGSAPAQEPLPLFAVHALVHAFDVLLILGAGLLATWAGGTDLAAEHFWLIAGIAAVIAAVLTLSGTTTMRALLEPLGAWRRIAGSLIAVIAAVAAGEYLFVQTPPVSYAELGLWLGLGAVALSLHRAATAHLVRGMVSAGQLERRAVIFGANGLNEELIAAMQDDMDSNVRICGFFDDRNDGRTAAVIGSCRRLGNLSQLVTYCRKNRVDLVIVALPIAAEARLAQVMKQLNQLPADIKLPAGSTKLKFTRRTYSRVGRVAMIDLSDKPIANRGAVAKWIFDKTIALSALIVLSPVMLAVAIAIKLDGPGPVFFRQRRYGFNNEPIEVLKFRSMHTALCDSTAAKLVTRDDPRVTRIGQIIRRTSLDELPQLFNVLSGELSLVGPRPHAFNAKAAGKLYMDAVDDYFARHKVKPGVTGWAQINGWRGETDTEEKIQKRVEYDLYYIENWSVMFDLYILLKTPRALLKSENAY
jgi:Undecaprenyl-phosphate glucose phosphotransferase